MDDDKEGRHWRMRVGLGGHIIGDHGDLYNKGVHKELSGKKSEYVAWRPIYQLCTGVKSMEGYSRFLRFWYQIKRPQKDIEGSIVKERIVNSVKNLIMSSSLAFCRRREAMIHTS